MLSTTIHIAQINTRVGDVSGNLERVIAAAQHAQQKGAEMVVFPELTLTGYPPEDLVLRHEFVAAQHSAFLQLVARSKTLPALVVGFIEPVEDRRFNALAFVDKGEVKHTHRKTLLPNYGVFDERRLFAVGQAPQAFTWNGKRIGMLLCEDAWQPHNARLLKAQGAELIIVANASPFEKGKHALRLQTISETARLNAVDVIYANLVGGQDDLVFDGHSFAVNAQGELVGELPAFEDAVSPLYPPLTHAGAGDEREMWNAITLATRDYVHKSGFKQAVLGLSGGIDSALVAAILAESLGAENVLGVLLPSPFTSHESNHLAQQLAEDLRIQAVQIPIEPCFEAMEDNLIPTLGALGYAGKHWQADLMVGGNLQSRLRGVHLMAISNATGRLLMNTSNKSEIAVGYSTLYGDACGAFAPIRDLYKTEVFALSRWRGLPAAIIDRAPTAELAPNQKDEDQLPPYAMLDAILTRALEGRMSAKDIAQQGFDAAVVARVFDMIQKSEYKRRQFPPGPKLSSMHFYKDWRMPITNGFTA
jgi:NAD+ synthetase